MRATYLAVLLSLLLTPSVATAAPTCKDRTGDTIRCGTPGAMPVGWSPSPQQLFAHQLSQPRGPSRSTLLKVFLGIGLLFVFIALLPEFDGSPAGGGWDQQEDDEETKP